MGKIHNGWQLTKMSLRVVTKDRKLLLFPVLSGAILLLILASYVGAMFFTGTLLHPNIDALFVAFWILFYFVSFFVVIFFNVALIACASKRLDGEDVPLSYGIDQAIARLKPIVMWAVVAATVGLIIRALEEKAGFIGRIVLGLIGAAWSLATFFVVPVIAFEGLTPLAALKRSLGLLKGSWGETIVSQLGLGLIFLALALLGLVPLLLAFILGGLIAGLVTLVAVVIYWVFLGILGSAASGVLMAALYRYATTGKVSEDFPAQVFVNPGQV